METINQYVGELKDTLSKPRSAVTQVLNLGLVVFSALMAWKGLIVTTGSVCPIVVVLSGSMEPAFQRGDILFLTMVDDNLVSGDVVVFQIPGREIPIVHRIVNVHYQGEWTGDPSGELAILTKGDNNQVDDRGLYLNRQLFISRREIMGRAYAVLPYVGMVTIWLNDYKWLKVAMLGSMGFFVIIGRE
jgi:signal peptidase